MNQTEGVDTLIERLLTGEAPERLRSAAARGALPLPRTALVRIMVHLQKDASAEIRTSADHSLQALEPEAIRECLAEKDCDPAVLAFFAPRAFKDNTIAERIVFHPATPEAVLGNLATTGNNSVVELILTNEEMLLARPALLERLMLNATLRSDQRGRLLEMLERVEKRREDAAKARQAAGEAEREDDEVEDVEEVANLLDVDVGELLAASEIIDGEEFAESPEPEIRDAYRRIVTLNTSQKAILAMKGGREERMILVRDSNKTVSQGVLKNPRITDGEIESIAKMRNVNEHVLRMVGAKRDWTKKYQVVLGLVQNPRTPPTVTTNFITRLTNKDLQGLFKSREVPELIRRMARRTFDMRNKR